MPANFLDELFFEGNTVQVEFRGPLLTRTVLLTTVQSIDDRIIQLGLANPDFETYPLLQPGIGLVISAREKNSMQVYYYTSTLTEFKNGNPAQLFLLRPPLIQTLSRRNFFRCDVDFPFSYWRDEAEKVEGKVVNLSASGLYGHGPHQPAFRVGMELTLEFTLPNQTQPSLIDAKLIRIQKTDNRDERGMAFHFSHPEEKLQNEIIKYLFFRQRELIQKGLIKIGTIQ